MTNSRQYAPNYDPALETITADQFAKMTGVTRDQVRKGSSFSQFKPASWVKNARGYRIDMRWYRRDADTYNLKVRRANKNKVIRRDTTLKYSTTMELWDTLFKKCPHLTENGLEKYKILSLIRDGSPIKLSEWRIIFNTDDQYKVAWDLEVESLPKGVAKC